jgi:uncharacterized membrane protein YgaE (UPF0421/DUF939 family)
MSMSVTFRSSKRGPFLQVAKSAVATIAAWLLAGWLVPGPPPVFAAIAALLVVQPSVNQSLAKGVERTVGVIVGVLVASMLGLLLGDGTWAVLGAIVAALALSWLLRMTPGTSNQVAISAMLVLALGTATPGYAVERVIETLIGALVGFAVNVAIVPPLAVTPVDRAIRRVGAELAATMQRLVDAVDSPRSPAELAELLERARALRPVVADAESALRDGEESLTLNPRARRNRARLGELRETLDHFTPVSTQLIGMTRTFVDRYDPSLGDEPTMSAITEQLGRAAHDVLLATDRAAGGSSSATGSAPALTRPLAVLTPSSDHWILLGSLLVDLERIHQSLADLAAGADRSGAADD